MTTTWDEISGATPLQGYSALSMANTYLADLGRTEPQEAQHTQQTVMLVAEYLHEEGHTLVWEELKVPEFFKRVAFMSEHDREGIALVLMGFYVWLCSRGFVLPQESEQIISDLLNLFPASEILARFHVSSQRMLDTLADMPLVH